VNELPVTPPVVADDEAYQIGVVPTAQEALKFTVVVAPTLHTEPPVTDIGKDGIGLTVTIYAT
jgi:hypothetical protein